MANFLKIVLVVASLDFLQKLLQKHQTLASIIDWLGQVDAVKRLRSYTCFNSLIVFAEGFNSKRLLVI